MTPRERVLAVLRGKPADKVPFTIYENKLPQCAVERRLRNEGMCIVNRHYSVFNKVAPNCVTESHTYTAESPDDKPGEALQGWSQGWFGSQPGRTRIRRVTRTPVGDVSSVEEPAGFTSWTVEHIWKKPEDYRTLLYIIRDTQYLPDYAGFLRAEQRLGDDVILRPVPLGSPLHTIMVHWMGVETFASEWAERRDEILKLERAMRENLAAAWPILAESPITHANLGGNEVPEVMGPPRYRQFCISLLNECAEALHKNGKLLGSHMDGNNKPWAEDLAACGLDYIEAFTPSLESPEMHRLGGTDMTLAEAFHAWPDKILWINFPSAIHLADIPTIKRAAREIIQTAADPKHLAKNGAGRLILGITEDIPEDRWQQNLLAISEVINE